MDELENAYQILLDYEKEVKEFLLYVSGTHSQNKKSSWINLAFSEYSKINQRQCSICCGAFSIITDAMSNELLPIDKIDYYNQLYGNVQQISRNISNWLCSAKILLDLYSNDFY